MYRRLVVAGLLCLAALAAHAAGGWARYQNDRYGYSIELPPGFAALREADNRDGGTTRSVQGNAMLAVWGTNLLVESFRSDVGSRIESASSDGWEISYKSVKTKRASWSGTRDERIFYAHGAPGCDGQAAYFQIEYDAAAKDDFDAIVRRLVKSFSARGECL